MRRFLHCLILPHPANNHRARLLSPKFLILSIFIFIFSALAITPRSLADISSNELFTFTNQKRVENGLPPLALNQALSLAASRKADDMFAKNYWAHNSPDGLTPWFFIKNAGYSYVYAGENLARGFHNANDVVNACKKNTGKEAKNRFLKQSLRYQLSQL
jgi:hypothetical protein